MLFSAVAGLLWLSSLQIPTMLITQSKSVSVFIYMPSGYCTGSSLATILEKLKISEWLRNHLRADWREARMWSSRKTFSTREEKAVGSNPRAVTLLGLWPGPLTPDADCIKEQGTLNWDDAVMWLLTQIYKAGYFFFFLYTAQNNDVSQEVVE